MEKLPPAAEELRHRKQTPQVVAAINLGTKRIAGFQSEVLVLGVPDAAGNVVLLAPERPVRNGVRVY
jgi:tRNA-binding protein